MKKLLMGGLLLLQSFAQDPSAAVEGSVLDRTGGAIQGARVVIRNLGNGFTQSLDSTPTGVFTFPVLPIGQYELTVERGGFAPYKAPSLQLNVNQTLRLNVLLDVAMAHETLQIEADSTLVQTGSSVLGSVVTHREVNDLPLNGRNFSQLGLLQLGVVPMTTGLTEQGGSRRSGHAYIVNGQRPESNNYLLDGSRAVNRIDGGFALKPPIDAIEEFKILTHTAPAEYGGASGGNTSVVTRSGTNEFHGSAYAFLRNDHLDARNFFVAETEPLKQNQFGATAGGPMMANRAFFFGYYEGFRNRQGITRGSTVPTPQQRAGDFSQSLTSLIDPTSGQPFPGGLIPASSISPLAGSLLKYYPAGNSSPSFFSSTQPLANDTNQSGLKLDFLLSSSDTLSARYALSSGLARNPFSILGADLPGFRVEDELRTQLFSLTETHIAGAFVNTFRGSFFRHWFLLERRLSGLAPRQLGFQYDSTLEFAQGAPFIIVNGYSNMGDPAIGPRDTTQNDYDFQDSLAHASGRHNFKLGVGLRRTQVNSNQGHYANGAFVFSTTPSNDSFANFLLGLPSQFTQAGGDFYRGLRSRDFNLYFQDEWRMTRRATLNYGARYEANTPFSEINDRLNAFAPGRQSVIQPSAPPGILYPGDPGVPSTIAPTFRKGLMPRIGLAWDVTGRGSTVLRAGYAIFYDALVNGVGGPLRVATQSLPWVTVRQVTGSVNFQQPLGSGAITSGVFALPMSLFTIASDLRPPYAQDWNFAFQQTLGSQVLDLRYVGTKGTRLPRFIEGNPAVNAPGATAANANRRRLYAGCTRLTQPCALGYAAIVTGGENSTYHSAQAGITRRLQGGLAFAASYTFSKTLDGVSSLHIAGPAPILVSGEMDLAQNPFNLGAEHGPSLFDARHRVVMNGTYEVPTLRGANRMVQALLRGWQLNGISTLSSGTPFTVYDSRNVSLQAPIPPVAGTFASRPDLILNPNDGPRRIEQWVSTGAFRRLNAITEAGQFGNEGRNVVRGPGMANLDLSLMRTFKATERLDVQCRAESFNALNHPNFGLPVNDLVSPNFGRIVESGPPRLLQFALKLLF